MPALLCHLLLLILVLTLRSNAVAQGQDVDASLSFDRLEQVKELHSQTINCIVQDNAGFMWFGSIDGLIRFDGYSTKLYRHEARNNTSLASNSIQALAKDRAGNIWIATEGAGLDKFDPTTEIFYHYQNQPDDPLSISDNSLVSVFVDNDQYVWVGTYSGGMNRLDPATGKFIRITEERYVPIRAIASDNKGHIWFSSNGLNRVDVKQLTVTHYVSQPNDPSSIGNGGIRTILVENDNSIYVGTHDEDGLFNFNIVDGKFIERPLGAQQKTSVYCLYKDPDQKIWMGTSRGLGVMTKQGVRFYKHDPCDEYSIGTKLVLNIYVDDARNMWFGCESYGVNKLLPQKKFQRYFYPDTRTLTNHNAIRSLCEDADGNILVGWVEGGVQVINPNTKTINSFPISGKDDINVIREDVDKTLWIGTWDAGLFHYEKSGRLIKRYLHENTVNTIPDNRVQSVVRDKFGVLWIATENGLCQLDTKTQKCAQFNHGALLGNNIQSLAFIEGPDGTLWAGTWSGLNRIAPDRKSVLHYKSKDAFNALNDHVISLYLDTLKSIMWIGTYEGGLRMLDFRTNAIRYFNTDNGLPNNTIFAIVPDRDGFLWLSTQKGISRLSTKDYTFRNFDQTDGLQGDEFFWGVALKTRKGDIMLGGISGLNLFNPVEIRDSQRTPRVVLTDFEIFNKPLPLGKNSVLSKAITYADEIQISYNQSVVTFEFAALNYVFPEKNQYAYQLTGFDQEWNYLKNKRAVTYTNLAPGDYTFKVKASNHDGVWNNEGKIIHIIVTPPFWRTWWFEVMITVFFASTLILFYIVRIGIMRKRQAELTSQVKERTQEIVKKNEEIVEQMNKVAQLNGEIASQRDSIEFQNNQLAIAKTELEQKVTERTFELSQTNQELIEQNAQLEQFAFMTAHNLRAPVARLLGLTSIFNGRDATDPLNPDIIKRIQSSASGLDEVIRDISDILQVKKGIHRTVEPVDIAVSLSKTLHALRHDIAAQGIEINTSVPEGIFIKGIPPYVHSVFYNIVSNAIKYADVRKPPRIDISINIAEYAVTIVFADNGIGFDVEGQREKLFKPFSRLNASREGKGLGLFLVKIQMESMNGDIELFSTTDQGTTVQLTFVRNQISLSTSTAD